MSLMVILMAAVSRGGRVPCFRALIFSLIGFGALPIANSQTMEASFDAYAEVDGKNAPAWLATLGRVTGSIKVGSAKELISIKGDRYYIESNVVGAAILSKLFDNLRVVRRSEGSWMPGGQATTRFYEKRGSSEAYTALIDYRKGSAGFIRGTVPVKAEPVRFLTSDTLAMPYVFLGRPRPSGPVTIAYTDGRSLRTATFDGTVVFPYEVAGQKVPTIRYVARRAASSDPDIEIWVRADDGFPVRIKVGLSAKYGVRADASATSLPVVLKR